MPTYLAFLRAINLGPVRKFPKTAIAAAVESVGFTEVETHINTGNVRFTTRMRSTARIEELLERAFLADRGFEVPTIVFAAREFAALATDATAFGETHARGRRHYVELLRDAPSATDARRIEAASTDGVEWAVRGRTVHTFIGDASIAGANTASIAKLIGVSTNRNVTVIRAVAQRWC